MSTPRAPKNAEKQSTSLQTLAPSNPSTIITSQMRFKMLQSFGPAQQEGMVNEEMTRSIGDRELAATLLNLDRASYQYRMLASPSSAGHSFFQEKKSRLGRRRAASYISCEDRTIEDATSNLGNFSAPLKPQIRETSAAGRMDAVSPGVANSLLLAKPNLKTRTPPASNIKLNNIPGDLIRTITNFLPLAATSCLSLTCKFIYGAIKADNLHFDHPNINRIHGEIHDFLTLLARDLPNQIPCFYCCKVHTVPLKIPAEYSILDGKKECLRADKELGTFKVLDTRFSFTQLQYAMKLHTTSRDASAYLSQLQRTNRIHSYYTENISYVVSEARINSISHEIIFRSQCWVIMPCDYLDDKARLKSAIVSGCHNFRICSHHGMYSESLLEKIACKFQHAKDPLCRTRCLGCESFWKCRNCELDVHVEFRE